MKKSLLAILIITSTHAFGQTHSLGIQGGGNIANIKADRKFDDTKIRTGFIGGLNYEMVISNKFSLSADVLYSQNGTREKWYLDNGTTRVEIGSYELKYYYDYICIPIKFGYLIGNKFKGFAKVGIAPSFIINAKYIYPIIDNDGKQTGKNETIRMGNNISKFDLGSLIELGCIYKLQNKIELFSSMSYKVSLIPFTYNDAFRNSKLRNFTFSLSLGVKFVLNPK